MPSLAANFQPALNQDESNYLPAKIAPLPLMILTFSTRTKTPSCLPLPALEGVRVPGSYRFRYAPEEPPTFLSSPLPFG